jgi:hypothetical protein
MRMGIYENKKSKRGREDVVQPMKYVARLCRFENIKGSSHERFFPAASSDPVCS